MSNRWVLVSGIALILTAPAAVAGGPALPQDPVDLDVGKVPGLGALGSHERGVEEPNAAERDRAVRGRVGRVEERAHMGLPLPGSVEAYTHQVGSSDLVGQIDNQPAHRFKSRSSAVREPARGSLRWLCRSLEDSVTGVPLAEAISESRTCVLNFTGHDFRPETRKTQVIKLASSAGSNLGRKELDREIARRDAQPSLSPKASKSIQHLRAATCHSTQPS